MPELYDVGKIHRFFKPSVATLEEAELLCTLVSDTGTSMIILLQEPLQGICSGA
jgi:hypothetical protein